MKQLTFYIILLMMFTSCMTTKRIQRHCAEFAKLCITETKETIVIKDTTIYKDRIIKVPLPKDTVYLEKELSVIDGQVYIAPVFKQTGLISVKAWVDKNKLKVDAWLNKTVWTVPVHDTIYLEGAIVEKEVLNTVVLPPERFIPAFYKRLLLFNIVLLVVVVFIALNKLKLINMQGLINTLTSKFKK